jgi:hypothetical protein
MDRPVTITLDGPGGGTWSLAPGAGGKAGKVETGPAGNAAAQITANAQEFALWATQRRPWRDHDVKIDGDEAYATRVLDAIRVV